jgi:hypothetical protein
MLFLLASDPRSFTATPEWSGLELIGAVLGAAVLVTTYVRFGKRLLDELKAELEKHR